MRHPLTIRKRRVTASFAIDIQSNVKHYSTKQQGHTTFAGTSQEELQSEMDRNISEESQSSYTFAPDGTEIQEEDKERNEYSYASH